jgi:hypothetical protein
VVKNEPGKLFLKKRLKINSLILVELAGNKAQKKRNLKNLFGKAEKEVVSLQHQNGKGAAFSGD